MTDEARLRSRLRPWKAAVTVVFIFAGVLFPAPRASASHPCFQEPSTHGTNGDDTRILNPYADVYASLDGDDTIYGEGGNDKLCGEEDEDALYGGPGADRLAGSTGIDDLFGQDGNDELNGGWGSEMGTLGGLNGGGGTDLIHGGEDPDSVLGGDGDDKGAASPKLFGDIGADTIRGQAGSDYADGGPGLNDDCIAEFVVNCEL